MPDAASPATQDDIERGRAALAEITPASTIGAPIGSVDEGDGVVSVYFGVEKPGYPGWRWTATIAHVDGVAPTVLEIEMTPGDGALLAPDWVPWVDRLADYHAAQDAAVLAAAEGGDSDGEDSDDEDSDDESGDDSDDVDFDGDESDDDDDSDDESDDDDDSDEADADDEDSEFAMRSRLHARDLDGVDIDSLDEEADDDDPDSDLSGDEESGGELGAGASADAASSASAADDVDQPEGAEHDAERAGDDPVQTEITDRRAEQQ